MLRVFKVSFLNVMPSSNCHFRRWKAQELSIFWTLFRSYKGNKNQKRSWQEWTLMCDNERMCEYRKWVSIKACIFVMPTCLWRCFAIMPFVKPFPGPWASVVNEACGWSKVVLFLTVYKTLLLGTIKSGKIFQTKPSMSNHLRQSEIWAMNTIWKVSSRHCESLSRPLSLSTLATSMQFRAISLHEMCLKITSHTSWQSSGIGGLSHSLCCFAIALSAQKGLPCLPGLEQQKFRRILGDQGMSLKLHRHLVIKHVMKQATILYCPIRGSEVYRNMAS